MNNNNKKHDTQEEQFENDNKKVQVKYQQEIQQIIKYLISQHPSDKKYIQHLQKLLKIFYQQRKNNKNDKIIMMAQQQFIQCIVKIKDILKITSKQVCNQQLTNLYQQFKKIIKPFLHHHHNNHQHPYLYKHNRLLYNQSHISTINSAHMKMNLLHQLEKQTKQRKQAQQKVQNLYITMQKAILKKQQNIQNLQTQLDKIKKNNYIPNQSQIRRQKQNNNNNQQNTPQKKTGKVLQKQNSLNKSKSINQNSNFFHKQYFNNQQSEQSISMTLNDQKKYKQQLQQINKMNINLQAQLQSLKQNNNQLIKYVDLLEQKVSKKQKQNQTNKQILKDLQNQIDHLIIEKQSLKKENQRKIQKPPQLNLLFQLQKTPTYQNISNIGQIAEKVLQNKNNYQSQFFNDNFNKSNENQGWNNYNHRNLTNLDLPPILGTPQSDRKAKSYYKAIPNSSSIKTDELWRFLIIQAQSIQNFVLKQQDQIQLTNE